MIKRKRFLIGWYILGISILLSLLFIFSGLFNLEKRISLPLGFLMLAFASYLAENIKEIRAPNVAFLFRMGKFVGRLDPGWYVVVPRIWDVKEIPTSWREISMEGEMYTSQQTFIKVRARAYYRADEECLDEVLRMLPEEMHKRAMVVGLAKLRGVIGEKEFGDLITKKGELEEAVKGILKNEFNNYGYHLRDFEIYDFDEKVWSEAKKIEALGEARARVERKIAEALARPLKDNWPAAAAKSVEAASKAVAQAIETSKRASVKHEGAKK